MHVNSSFQQDEFRLGINYQVEIKEPTPKCRLIFTVQCTVGLQICPAVGCISAGQSLNIDLAPW